MPKLMKGSIQGAKRAQLLFSVGLLIALALLAIFNAGHAAEQVRSVATNEKVKTVVIDPGHGGHDSGCLGSSAKEKDVALAISLRLGKLIEENFKDVKVIFTRKTDVFVELYRRAQIANENNADLFICIHCNSGPKAAYGVETYVMGLHKTTGNLDVAKRENESVLMESNYKANYDGYDPNSPEADIIFSLYQSAYLDRSLSFAAKVQDQARNYAKRYDRKVRQAGFLVLWKTAMPSVLIETGFLTNGDEHTFLASKKGQESMSNAIYRAFVNYKGEVEGVKYDNLLQSAGTIAEEGPEEPAKQPEKPVVENTPASQTVVEKEPVDERPIVNPGPEEDLGGIIYRVQFYSSPNKTGTTSSKFKGLDNVYEYKAGNNYRYTAGKYTSFKEALKYQSTVRSKGYNDAFVVVFKNGTRLMGDEAKKYLK